jgi:SAM-dependent methyltransferase
MLEDRLSNDDLLHSRLGTVANELWGLDLDREGIESLKMQGFANLCHGSAEEPPATVPRAYFDTVIAGEVIEHVRNVGRFLDSTAELLAPGGSLVITTPNALRYYNAIPALIRKELIHPDHVAWYSPQTLRRAVELSPFSVESILVYDLIPRANPSSSRNSFGRLFRRAFNLIARPTHAAAVWFAPYTADGLILTARVR